MTIAAAKLAIRQVNRDAEQREINAVDAAVAVCFASEDYQEGRQAFAQKRKPVFKGR